MKSAALVCLLIAEVAFATTASAARRTPARRPQARALGRVSREYDWRGAEGDVAKVAYRLGRAIGTRLVRKGTGRPPVAAVGGDGRLTTPEIKARLIRGLRATGVDVIDIGRTTTPEANEAQLHLAPDATLQVTASHNRRDQNGVKAIVHGRPVFGEELRAIGREAARGDFASLGRVGRLEHRRITRAYLARVRRNLHMGPRRFTVVVDANNGVGGALVRLLRGYGFETIGMNLVSDGRFPRAVDHRPDPTIEANLEALKRKVKATGAELGIALDADADRVVAVDRDGRTLLGDTLMALLAPRILAEAPGAAFAGEVTASEVPRQVIEAAGGRFVRGRAGRTYIARTMERENAVMGAEVTGHIWSRMGYDDGLFAGALLVEELSHGTTTLTDRVDRLPRLYATPIIRLPVAEKTKLATVERVKRHLRAQPGIAIDEQDGVRATWPDGAWALVRASGTGPELSVRFEAGSPERLAEVRSFVESLLDPR